MNITRVILVAITLLMLSGCISTKSYVDPQFHRASYNDIKHVQDIYFVNLTVEFQRNGEHMSKYDKEVYSFVDKALRGTAVVVPETTKQEKGIHVIVNNVGDLGEAAAKGFGVGLTFGAVGTVVTDYYKITVEYSDGTRKVVKNLKHALHSTIGNKAAPIENVEPTTILAGFEKVIEDAILNFVKDMQDQGLLTLNSHPQGSAS